MKRMAIGLVVGSMALGLGAAPGFASTSDIPNGMVEKAKSGVIDLFTGVVEIPVQTVKGYKKGFKFIKNNAGSKTVGTVLGLFRGFGHAAGRTGWGAMELFGFWTANPEDNLGVGIPLDAQYAWEEGEQYDLFSPSLKEGVKPIGQKLAKGLANSFLGIAELPGQTIKGKNEGSLGKGIVKGIWFWASREVYGIGSIYSCIVPNPEDNPGYAYEGEWPWSALSSEEAGS